MQSNTRIPKVIHYCWFGKNEMPTLNMKCIDSWKRLLPDYDLELWNEERFDVNMNQFTREAYQMRKWAFVLDYVRLYALYHYGGIYIDTDVEVLRPLDRFLVHSAFTGFESSDYVPTGIMGAEKGNKWVERLLEYYEDKRFIVEGGLDTTPNTAIITDLSIEMGLSPDNSYQILDHDVHIYPKEFFCPMAFDSLRKDITDNTYAIHYFSGSWLSRSSRMKVAMRRFLSALKERFVRS